MNDYPTVQSIHNGTLILLIGEWIDRTYPNRAHCAPALLAYLIPPCDIHWSDLRLETSFWTCLATPQLILKPLAPAP